MKILVCLYVAELLKVLVIINAEILTGEVLTLTRVRLWQLAYGEYSFSANMLIIIFNVNLF